jgi:hypothetical protein
MNKLEIILAAKYLFPKKSWLEMIFKTVQDDGKVLEKLV